MPKILLTLTILFRTLSVFAQGGFKYVKECKETACPGDAVYHCLTDENWDLVETCMERRMIQKKMCPYFNTYQGNMDARLCTGAMQPGDCPTTDFFSNEGSKYPNCMSPYVMPSTAVRTTTLNPTYTMASMSSEHYNDSIVKMTPDRLGSGDTINDSQTSKGEVTAIVIPIIVVLVAVVCVICIIIKRKKRDPNFSIVAVLRGVPCLSSIKCLEDGQGDVENGYVEDSVKHDEHNDLREDHTGEKTPFLRIESENMARDQGENQTTPVNLNVGNIPEDHPREEKEDQVKSNTNDEHDSEIMNTECAKVLSNKSSDVNSTDKSRESSKTAQQSIESERIESMPHHSDDTRFPQNDVILLSCKDKDYEGETEEDAPLLNKETVELSESRISNGAQFLENGFQKNDDSHDRGDQKSDNENENTNESGNISDKSLSFNSEKNSSASEYSTVDEDVSVKDNGDNSNFTYSWNGCTAHESEHYNPMNGLTENKEDERKIKDDTSKSDNFFDAEETPVPKPRLKKMKKACQLAANQATDTTNAQKDNTDLDFDTNKPTEHSPGADTEKEMQE